MTTSLASDCFAFPGKRMPMAEALALLQERSRPMVGIEPVPLAEAAGRVLAAPLVAPRDVPAFENAAVDGFAFAWTEPMDREAVALPLAEGRAAAGHPHLAPLPAGSCLRVLTGAAMPEGADTVALQESVALEAGRVRLPAGLRRGANRRKAGEDIRCGATAIEAGVRLAPQHVGVAAELGCAELTVHRRLRVALLSSGDELRDPGQPGATGSVYDANRYVLRALLGNMPAEIHDLGILRDDADVVRRTLLDAATMHDVILTTGGASRGDEDHVVRSVGELGRLDLWQIAMKPGRPLAFGRLGDAVFIGLPGNPVATMVCFLRFARPVLLRLAGAAWSEPRAMPVTAGFAMRKAAGRCELLRSRIAADGKGGWIATRVPREGSGVLTTMTEAHGLVELAAEVTEVREGELVPFLTFAELGCNL
jgi:molybdopterin molybdotransferase